MSIVPFANVDYRIPDYSKKELCELSKDVFLNMAEHIYKTYGFGSLGNYYFSMKNMNNDLIDTFLELYDYIDFEDNENIIKKLQKFKDIKLKFFDDLINININIVNELHFKNIILYFDNLNFEDFDYRQNGECIISSLHLEWLKRINQIGTYYQSIQNDIDKAMIKKPRSISSYIKKALGFTSSEKPSVKQLTYDDYVEINANIDADTDTYADADIDAHSHNKDEVVDMDKKSLLKKSKHSKNSFKKNDNYKKHSSSKFTLSIICFVVSIKLYFSELRFQFFHLCGMINNNSPAINPFINYDIYYNPYCIEYKV